MDLKVLAAVLGLAAPARALEKSAPAPTVSGRVAPAVVFNFTASPVTTLGVKTVELPAISGPQLGPQPAPGFYKAQADAIYEGIMADFRGLEAARQNTAKALEAVKAAEENVRRVDAQAQALILEPARTANAQGGSKQAEQLDVMFDGDRLAKEFDIAFPGRFSGVSSAPRDYEGEAKREVAELLDGVPSEWSERADREETSRWLRPQLHAVKKLAGGDKILRDAFKEGVDASEATRDFLARAASEGYFGHAVIQRGPGDLFKVEPGRRTASVLAAAIRAWAKDPGRRRSPPAHVAEALAMYKALLTGRREAVDDGDLASFADVLVDAARKGKSVAAEKLLEVLSLVRVRDLGLDGRVKAAAGLLEKRSRTAGRLQRGLGLAGVLLGSGAILAVVGNWLGFFSLLGQGKPFLAAAAGAIAAYVAGDEFLFRGVRLRAAAKDARWVGGEGTGDADDYGAQASRELDALLPADRE